MYVFLTVVLAITAVAAGCVSTPATEDGKPILLVTVPPMTEIVSAVAGDGFAVISVVPEGVSPHTYEPAPADVARFASADVWFTLSGGLLPLEDQVAAALADLRCVPTNSGIAAVAEAAGDGDELDPHIWLSAKNGILMTESVRNGLAAQYPEYAGQFALNAEKYRASLTDVDAALHAAVEAMEPKTFLTTHGSFGYLAVDYNITQLVIAREGKEPAARDLAKIIDEARRTGVHLVIIEPLSGGRTAEVLAEELGIAPAKINPLSLNYVATLAEIAEVLGQ